MSNKNRIQAQLRARLRALMNRLDEMEHILCEPEEDDLEERAGEWDDDNVVDGLARMTREEIRLIQAALRRLVEGSYGRCEDCGRPIGSRRLRTLPHTSTCVGCARAAA